MEFVAARPEFGMGERLRTAFSAGEITRLCDCGCNSFDLRVDSRAAVKPLAAPGNGGCIFQMDFSARQVGEISFCLFVDNDGNFSGLDVFCLGSSVRVPEEIDVVEPPYRVERATCLFRES